MRRRLAIHLLALVLGGCGGDPSVGGDPAGGGGAGAAAGGGGSAGHGGQATGPGGGGEGGEAGEGGAGGSALVDGDGDGLDDGVEAEQARDYYPFLAIHPEDDCPLHGVVYRLAPHPLDPSKRMVWYSVLYENDCGLNGHVGDNEVIGVVFDPTLVAPGGILAVRTISHQATLCEQVTTCGSLPGCGACTQGTRLGLPYPVAFASRNKHGGYVDEGTCDLSIVCDLGGCELPPLADDPSLVNAGEPGAPLVGDLSAAGFITDANGWTEPLLFGFDPWGASDFGDAGNVAEDLQDPAFVIDPEGC